MSGNKKRPGYLPDLPWDLAFDSASTSVVKGKRIPDLSGCLQVAGRHLARLVVALHVVGKLLAFNDFAHAGAFNCRDVNECVRAAVVRLNEAEALGGIEPFYCASGHNEPFHSVESAPARMRCGGNDF